MIHLGFDIDDLIILKLLLTEPTVTGVAKIMRLSQEAVSQRLKVMSARLDYKLHIRHGRGINLTVKGRELAETAKSALRILEKLKIEPDVANVANVANVPNVPNVPKEQENKAPDTTFKVSGRSLVFSYMNKK